MPSTDYGYLESLADQDNLISTSSKHRRAQRGGQLNRLAAMHGEDLHYSTEVNGLKAISHLSFISHVISLANEEIQRATQVAAAILAGDGNDDDARTYPSQDWSHEEQ